jgi:hypothetical protein
MSDQHIPNDAAQSRLDAALARIDAVIETVSGRLQQSRQDRQSLIAERDRAVGDLVELRRRYEELQAKADHAASRIDALVAIVQRMLLDGEAEASGPGADHRHDGHGDGGQHDHHHGHHSDGGHHGYHDQHHQGGDADHHHHGY